MQRKTYAKMYAMYLLEINLHIEIYKKLHSITFSHLGPFEYNSFTIYIHIVSMEY